MSTHLAVDQPNVHLELDLSDDDPLAQVRAFRGLEGTVEAWTLQTIGKARRAGHSWADIGNALGISRQAAWEMYRDRGWERIEKRVQKSGLTEEEAMAMAAGEIRAFRKGRRSSS